MKSTKTDLQKLGKRQRNSLNTAIRYGGWFPGCGWLYGNKSETISILGRLEKRGFMEQARVNGGAFGWVPTQKAHDDIQAEKDARNARAQAGADTLKAEREREEQQRLALLFITGAIGEASKNETNDRVVEILELVKGSGDWVEVRDRMLDRVCDDLRAEAI